MERRELHKSIYAAGLHGWKDIKSQVFLDSTNSFIFVKYE